MHDGVQVHHADSSRKSGNPSHPSSGCTSSFHGRILWTYLMVDIVEGINFELPVRLTPQSEDEAARECGLFVISKSSGI